MFLARGGESAEGSLVLANGWSASAFLHVLALLYLSVVVIAPKPPAPPGDLPVRMVRDPGASLTGAPLTNRYTAGRGEDDAISYLPLGWIGIQDSLGAGGMPAGRWGQPAELGRTARVPEKTRESPGSTSGASRGGPVLAEPSDSAGLRDPRLPAPRAAGRRDPEIGVAIPLLAAVSLGLWIRGAKATAVRLGG